MATEKRPTLTLSKKKRDPNAPKVSVARNPNVSIGVVRRNVTEHTAKTTVDESTHTNTNNHYETKQHRSQYGYHNDRPHRQSHDQYGHQTGHKKPFNKKPRPTPTRPAGVQGRMELTIKVNELPNNVLTVKNQWRQFDVQADDQVIRLRIRPKAWNKMAQANEQWESWVAAITGKMGNPIKNGFELLQPAVQVYEKKLKSSQDDEEDDS